MTHKKPKPKMPTIALALAMSLALGGVLFATAPAAAHICEGNSHSACNGHSCPDDGVSHSHYTNHRFWWDHWCSSSPSTGVMYGPLNAFHSEDVDKLFNLFPALFEADVDHPGIPPVVE